MADSQIRRGCEILRTPNLHNIYPDRRGKNSIVPQTFYEKLYATSRCCWHSLGNEITAVVWLWIGNINENKYTPRANNFANVFLLYIASRKNVRILSSVSLISPTRFDFDSALSYLIKNPVLSGDEKLLVFGKCNIPKWKLKRKN